MHTIHTTAGFIVGSRPYGDAGKILNIFTREFGLIYATAQGIRLEKSKLRYHIQDYSFGTYSLVRGREYWRIVSASTDIRCDLSAISWPVSLRAKLGDLRLDAQEIVARIALLLRRLLHGEEAHPELFDYIIACAKFLEMNYLANVSGQAEEIITLESLIVARMLFTLGYIGNISGIDSILQSKHIDRVLLVELHSKRTLLNQHINRALKESML